MVGNWNEVCSTCLANQSFMARYQSNSGLMFATPIRWSVNHILLGSMRWKLMVSIWKTGTSFHFVVITIRLGYVCMLLTLDFLWHENINIWFFYFKIYLTVYNAACTGTYTSFRGPSPRISIAPCRLQKHMTCLSTGVGVKFVNDCFSNCIQSSENTAAWRYHRFPDLCVNVPTQEHWKPGPSVVRLHTNERKSVTIKREAFPIPLTCEQLIAP